MRQREPDRALQAKIAFRPKGSPCPFGTQPHCGGNTHDPNLPVLMIVYLYRFKIARADRLFLHIPTLRHMPPRYAHKLLTEVMQMQKPCIPGNGSRALAVAAVITAEALTRGRTADEIGEMAAFFTILGDTMTLFSFDPQLKRCQEELNRESL